MIYKSLDIVKFIMALFVVTIHCYIVNEIQIDCLKRISSSVIYSVVPFLCHIFVSIISGIFNIIGSKLLTKVYSNQNLRSIGTTLEKCIYFGSSYII